MNTVKKNKKHGFLRAYDKEGKVIAIAGTPQLLMELNIISAYEGSLDQWLILPTSNPQKGFLRDTEQKAREAMENM